MQASTNSPLSTSAELLEDCPSNLLHILGWPSFVGLAQKEAAHAPCQDDSSKGCKGRSVVPRGCPARAQRPHTHIAQPGKGDPSAWETLGIAGMPWDHISFFSQRFSSPYVFNCSAHSFNIFSPFILSCFQIWKSFKRFWQEIRERVGSIFLPVSYFDVALLFLFPSFFFSFGTSAFIC